MDAATVEIIKIVVAIIIVALIIAAAKGLWEFHKDVKDTELGNFLLNQNE